MGENIEAFCIRLNGKAVVAGVVPRGDEEMGEIGNTYIGG